MQFCDIIYFEFLYPKIFTGVKRGQTNAKFEKTDCECIKAHIYKWQEISATISGCMYQIDILTKDRMSYG